MVAHVCGLFGRVDSLLLLSHCILFFLLGSDFVLCFLIAFLTPALPVLVALRGVPAMVLLLFLRLW